MFTCTQINIIYVYFLNSYKQLANWFDMLNRDKNLLRIYYDFKSGNLTTATTPTTSNANTSGDSGVSSEFMYASHASSHSPTPTTSQSCSMSSNISSSNQHQQNTPANNNNGQIYELTSLANVSVFEHDEYFSYFLKLIQQFHSIDFHIRLNSTSAPATTTATITQTSTAATLPPQPPAHPSSKHLATSNSFQQTSHMMMKQQQQQQLPGYNNHAANSSGGSTTSTGSTSAFNLKNISRRLNIKSWFTSSSNMAVVTAPAATSSSKHQSTTTLFKNSNATARLTNFTQQHKHKMAAAERAGNLGTGVGCALVAQQQAANGVNNNNNNNHTGADLMKHSLSEPSLNAIINA